MFLQQGEGISVGARFIAIPLECREARWGSYSSRPPSRGTTRGYFIDRLNAPPPALHCDGGRDEYGPYLGCFGGRQTKIDVHSKTEVMLTTITP
jgi:hypothetical protein